MSLITDQRTLLKLALSLAVDLDYLIQSIKSDPTDLNHEARPAFIHGIRLFVENAINGETPDLTMLDDYGEMPVAPPEAPPEYMGLVGSSPVAATKLGSAPSEPLIPAKVADPAPVAPPQHMGSIVNPSTTTAKPGPKSPELLNRVKVTKPMPVANAPAVLDTPGTAVLAPKPPAPIKPLPPLKKAPPQLAATTPLIPPELSPGHPNLEKLADRCIGLLSVPGHVTSSMVAEQILGGPLRSLERVPHRSNKFSNFFISFLYQKASLDYMNFRKAPTGKLYFAATENGYTPISVEWSSKKPEPITTDILEGLKAPNPVRRALAIRNYPRTIVGQDEYSRRLEVLKAKNALDFTMESFKLTRELGACVVFSKISGAVQVMAWHSRGLFGSEFNDCQVTYGIDPTDRPIPVINNEPVISAVPVKVKPAVIPSKGGVSIAPKAASPVSLGSSCSPTNLSNSAPSKPSGSSSMPRPLAASSVTTSRNVINLTADSDLRTSSHRFILSASASKSSARAYTLPESLCLPHSASRLRIPTEKATPSPAITKTR